MSPTTAQVVRDELAQIIYSVAIREPVLSDKVDLTAVDFLLDFFGDQVIRHLDGLKLF